MNSSLDSLKCLLYIHVTYPRNNKGRTVYLKWSIRTSSSDWLWLKPLADDIICIFDYFCVFLRLFDEIICDEKIIYFLPKFWKIY